MQLAIEDKIEELRVKLVNEAFLQGCLVHEKVVAISQELDEYLLDYLKML